MYGLGSEEVEFCDKYSSCPLFFLFVCVKYSEHERFYVAAVDITTLTF